MKYSNLCPLSLQNITKIYLSLFSCLYRTDKIYCGDPKDAKNELSLLYFSLERAILNAVTISVSYCWGYYILMFLTPPTGVERWETGKIIWKLDGITWKSGRSYGYK